MENIYLQPSEVKLTATPQEIALTAQNSDIAVNVAPSETPLTIEPQNVNLETQPNSVNLEILTGATVNNYYGSSFYEHSQAVPSATWTITHGLGKNPSVTVIDSGGSYILPDISYTNSNTLVLTFSVAFGGYAYLN